MTSPAPTGPTARGIAAQRRPQPLARTHTKGGPTVTGRPALGGGDAALGEPGKWNCVSMVRRGTGQPAKGEGGRGDAVDYVGPLDTQGLLQPGVWCGSASVLFASGAGPPISL